jgi:NAD(P)-dependent dehydrogenase (short-subunit alcohol dehydrogenase family)
LGDAMSSAPSKYAIVTGGASGLGREFCLNLARDGYEIAIVDVNLAGAEETARLVTDCGGSGRVENVDVTSIDAWTSLRGRLQNDWPRLDLLVNNAGMYAAGYVGSLDLAETERLLKLNVSSVLYGCHTLAPWLAEYAKARPTRIINVASSFAFLCPPGMAAYNLSKAAVVALSETLCGELKPRGVRVTVVCPGPMPTRFVESASFESEAFRRMTESYVKNSSLEPAEVAVASLKASERGQLYVVMGRDQRWYWRAKRWLPQTLLSRVARRVRKDLAAAKKLPEN